MYIVTGASSGIGRATAIALIARQCVVMVAARSEGPLSELKQMAPELVHPVPADLGTEQGIADLLSALDGHDTISGIVHGAGSAVVPTPYSRLDPASMGTDMAVHVGAPIALNGALRPRLVGGRVVYLDSYSATSLRQGWSGYSIVKAAAQMAARAAASELDEVEVIRLFPGGVRTALVEAVLTSDVTSPAVETFRALDQQGELVPPEVIGTFVASLLLDATESQLRDRETWDFTKAADRIF